MKLSVLLTILSLSFVCSNKQENSGVNKNIPPDGVTKTKNESANKKMTSKDDIVIQTSDSKELSASYFYVSESKNTPSPLVVLVHQFLQTKEQWHADFIDSLITEGFKVLAYDIRGHGKSTKVDYDMSRLLEDPDEAPNDIRAVFNWAKNEKGIDTSRIGVMGTSIGGNLACFAALNLNAKAIISVSNGKRTFELFTGYDERMMGRPFFPKFKNALFICGNKDSDVEQGQKWIIDNFVEFPKEHKVYDSEKHGKFLIEDFPEINSISINWFKKYL